MSYLLKKSDENLEACQLLIETHQLYTASVHNAYYSSFQRSMHVLQTHFPQADARLGGGSSHIRTINALEQKLRNGGSHLDALDFNQWINELKRKRVYADYKDLRFNEPESQETLRLAQKLNQLLDKADQSFSSGSI